MAPFLALAPYKSVAAAPFKTVIVSTSSGFISPALLPKSAPALPCGTELVEIVLTC